MGTSLWASCPFRFSAQDLLRGAVGKMGEEQEGL